MKKMVIIGMIILLLVAARMNDHIYGLWVFYGLGRDITVNMKDDLEKAEAVAYWVFDNIKGCERYEDFTIIDDNFMNVYRRRMGSCDQSAWVYVVMANLLGLDSRVLFLINDKGISPHTVAITKVKGDTYVVDTTIHYMFSLSDKEAFKEYQDLFKEYYDRWFKNKKDDSCVPDISWFEKGVYSDSLKEKIVKRLLRKN